MIRAKFKVDSVLSTFVGKDRGYIVSLTPVVSGSEENSQFYKYTPSGSITLSTINAFSAQEFQAGGEFYVEFTNAN